MARPRNRAGFTLLGIGLGWIENDVAHVRTEPRQVRAELNAETVANRHQLSSVSERLTRIETPLEERLPERSRSPPPHYRDPLPTANLGLLHRPRRIPTVLNETCTDLLDGDGATGQRRVLLPPREFALRTGGRKQVRRIPVRSRAAARYICPVC